MFFERYTRLLTKVSPEFPIHFLNIYIIKTAAGEDILRRLTPLSGLQEDILQRLGLGAALYGQLEIQVIGT